MRTPCIATKSSPRSPQLEKARTQQWRPNAAKKNKKTKKKTFIAFSRFSFPLFPYPKILFRFWSSSFPTLTRSQPHSGWAPCGQNYVAVISHIIQKGNNRAFKPLDSSVLCRTELGTCKSSAWSSCKTKTKSQEQNFLLLILLSLRV